MLLCSKYQVKLSVESYIEYINIILVNFDIHRQILEVKKHNLFPNYIFIGFNFYIFLLFFLYKEYKILYNILT